MDRRNPVGGPRDQLWTDHAVPAPMDAYALFLTEEFTVAGMTFQYWMLFVGAILLIWLTLALASEV